MTNGNDPIQHDPCRDDGNVCSLTKREYFAAMALLVINWHAALHDSQVKTETIAQEAVGIAEALILELSKAPK